MHQMMVLDTSQLIWLIRYTFSFKQMVYCNKTHLQGFVTISKPLDFETTQSYFVNILASDRASEPANRRTSHTVLTVKVEDSDDQDPIFTHQVYTSRVVSGVSAGVLDIQPDKVQAEDQDSLRSEIFYTLVSGKPGFFKYCFHH